MLSDNLFDIRERWGDTSVGKVPNRIMAHQRKVIKEGCKITAKVGDMNTSRYNFHFFVIFFLFLIKLLHTRSAFLVVAVIRNKITCSSQTLNPKKHY